MIVSKKTIQHIANLIKLEVDEKTSEIFSSQVSDILGYVNILKEKSKRLQEQLKSIDKKFEKLYTSALIEKNIDKKYKNINKLVNYIEKLIGGKRSKEWILRSKCTAE